jgi:acyl-CoA thioesterase FadM
MNRLFRLLWLALRSRWAPKCPTLGPSTLSMRVWPNDLDVFLHVNNGVYFTLCDLARVDLMLRSGTSGVTAGPRRPFLVAAQTIQLHRPLRLFERFRIETRVLGWDEKAFFVEHRFFGNRPRADGGDDRVALAVVEGRVFDAKAGPIAPPSVLAQLGLPPESSPLPEWVERWKNDQRAVRNTWRGLA